MTDYPRDKQVVLICMVGGAKLQARFYEHLSVSDGPGYSFLDANGTPGFCTTDDVVSWLDDSANDPLGYDLSKC